MNTQFLGLGKTKFNSSICLIDESVNTLELLLTERLIRKKNSGAWPEMALREILPRLDKESLLLAENRDVHLPVVIEDIQNQLFPFYDFLQKNNLDFFLSRFNPKLQFVPHHLAHASAALALSPFDKAIIVVMDGAGTEISSNNFEECTVYLQDGVKLTPVFERFVSFGKSQNHPTHTFGNRTGAAYEKVSEFIFNSPHSSGKVMGLASFGKAEHLGNILDFQEKIIWKNAFSGKTKKDWEKRDHNEFINLAASIQNTLEGDYAEIISFIKKNFPEYRNLILTGGCALNCTNNAKILYQNLFDKIFIPPFPGDESIAFGLAHYLKFQQDPTLWSPVLFENQSAYFGQIKSVPSENLIESLFDTKSFELFKSKNICNETAKLLSEGKIIAWFQDRSESGPRALGNRSILVRPDIKGIKDRLNETIKFRENFRPYGCSVLHSKGNIYFEVEPGFDNPYMSYAVKVRKKYQDLLLEVSHVDGTSRMQTVRVGQNKKFYELLEAFGKITDLYCLLNTSLNVMDEPILENAFDAKKFLLNVPVDYLAIGDYLIRRKI
jgi:carbamoyltransferase